MMATIAHVTSGLGLRKFQDDGFLLDRVYITKTKLSMLFTIIIRTQQTNANA